MEIKASGERWKMTNYGRYPERWKNEKEETKNEEEKQRKRTELEEKY